MPSFIKAFTKDVQEAAQAKIDHIDKLRRDEDRSSRQSARRSRIKWHRFLRKISFGLIQLPMLSHDGADCVIRSREHSWFYYPCDAYGAQRLRCKDIIHACKRCEEVNMLLSVEDVTRIDL